MSEKVICNICGQVQKVRKSSSMGAFPVSHPNPNHDNPCHGFFVVSNTFPQKEQ